MPDQKYQRDLLRGSLDLLVLSVLADEPMYGYLIQKRLRQVSAERVRLAAGTLYPLLHRLEADGAVSSRHEKVGQRDRKWYELTSAGRKRLSRQADQWRGYVECMRQLLPAPSPAL